LDSSKVARKEKATMAKVTLTTRGLETLMALKAEYSTNPELSMEGTSMPQHPTTPSSYPFGFQIPDRSQISTANGKFPSSSRLQTPGARQAGMIRFPGTPSSQQEMNYATQKIRRFEERMVKMTSERPSTQYGARGIGLNTDIHEDPKFLTGYIKTFSTAQHLPAMQTVIDDTWNRVNEIQAKAMREEHTLERLIMKSRQTHSQFRDLKHKLDFKIEKNHTKEEMAVNQAKGEIVRELQKQQEHFDQAMEDIRKDRERKLDRLKRSQR
jgi:hypothetical protein